MINPKHVRFGNYFNHYGKIKRLEPHLSGKSLVYKLEPIELTTVILYKLGFEEDEYDHWLKIDDDFKIKKLKDGSFMQYSDFKEIEIGIPMRFVHELQNRYQSLTGNELHLHSGNSFRQ